MTALLARWRAARADYHARRKEDLMDYPETRTHGPESAIDDNMETGGPIPGADAIPADMPNATAGDMPLKYDLQTFNGLVAANTAMQTELSSLGEKIELLTQQRDSFMEGLSIERDTTKSYLGQIKDLQAADRDSRDKLTALEADKQFAVDERDFLQRRLDRALGYLDRTLDEEEGATAPATQMVPAPQPTVGPNFDDIERPRRRRANEAGIDPMFAGTVRMAEPYGRSRHRRY